MTINYNGIDLPEWLFYFSKKTMVGASPTDSLNIVSSLNGGDRWGSVTTPSSMPKHKSIVVTKTCLKRRLKLDVISLSGWLQANGFDVYILGRGSNHHDVFQLLDIKLSAEAFSQLTDFDTNCHYGVLAHTFNLPRDNVVVLDDKKIKEIIDCLDEYQSVSERNRHCFSRGYKISFHKNFDMQFSEEISNSSSLVKDQEMQNKIAYLLKYNPTIARQFIGKIHIDYLQVCLRHCNDVEMATEIFKHHQKAIEHRDSMLYLFEMLSPTVKDEYLDQLKIENFDDFLFCYKLCHQDNERKKSLLLRHLHLADTHSNILELMRVERFEYNETLRIALFKLEPLSLKEIYVLASVFKRNGHSIIAELISRIVKKFETLLDQRIHAKNLMDIYGKVFADVIIAPLTSEQITELYPISDLKDDFIYMILQYFPEQYSLLSLYVKKQCSITYALNNDLWSIDSLDAKLTEALVRKDIHTLSNEFSEPRGLLLIEGLLGLFEKNNNLELVSILSSIRNDIASKLLTSKMKRTSLLALAKCLPLYDKTILRQLLVKHMGAYEENPPQVLETVNNLDPEWVRMYFEPKKHTGIISSIDVLKQYIRNWPEETKDFLDNYISKFDLLDRICDNTLCQDNEKSIEFMERYLKNSCKKKFSVYIQPRGIPVSAKKNNIIKSHLFLADLNSLDYLQRLFEEHQLDDLVVVEIACFNSNNSLERNALYDLIDNVQKYCPKIKQFILPTHALNVLILNARNRCSGTLPFECVDYGSYHDASYSVPLDVNVSLDSIDECSLNLSTNKPVCVSIQKSPKKNTFYIATNTNLQTFLPDYSDRKSAFEMGACGALLNTGVMLPQDFGLRTGIIIRDLSQDLSQSIYMPQLFCLPEYTSFQYLKTIDLEFMRKAKDILYFNLKKELNKDSWVRLWSALAEDTLHSLVDMPPNIRVSIKRGDDDFFYARSTEHYILNYVISIPAIPQYGFNHLAKNVKKVISQYKGSFNYKECSSLDIPMPKLEHGKVEQYLDALYTTCAGTCAHRVEAVKHKLLQRLPSSKVRILGIEDKHERLEIEVHAADGSAHWVQVDLGGGAANMVYKSAVPASLKHLAVDPNDDLQLVTAVNKDLPLSLSEREATAICLEINERDTTERQLAISKLMQVNTENLKVISEVDLVRRLVTEKNKSLLITDQTEEHAIVLIQEAIKNKQLIYYVDNFSKLDFDKVGVFLSQDGQAAVSEIGLCEQFLLAAKNANASLMIINWEAFSPKQRLMLNTVIDNVRSLMGRNFPEQVKVGSLCKELIDESSFTFRHDQILKLACTQAKISKLKKSENGNENEYELIDLEGLSDWQKAFFGPVVLGNNIMEWQKSDVIKKVLSGNNNKFKIINVSDKNKKEIEHAIKQGFFEYHGYKLFVDPINIHVGNSANNFNFNLFSAVVVKENVVADQIKDSARICVINTDIFDRLLINKVVKQKQYFEMPGLIANAKNNDLTLYVTSSLTTEQWYCLFSRCYHTKNNVKLKLLLAPGVTLPQPSLMLQEKPTEELKHEREAILQEPFVYVCDSSEYALKKVFSLNEKIAPFDVEDHTYDGLIYAIDFTVSKSGLTDFFVKIQPVLQKLINGETVVLKGEFSEKFCRCLEPILIQKKIELPTGTIELTGKLILIVENQQKNIFSWIPKGALIKIVAPENTQNICLPILPILEPQPDDETEFKLLKEGTESALLEIKKRSAQFMSNRQDLLLNALKTHNIVQLVGETGVGKSRLLLGLQEKQIENNCVIYNELIKTNDWLKDKSQQTKILFVDEVNIEDKHLTMFNALKHIGSREIIYAGECLAPDAHHKLVTAKNPEYYGGGRNKQKLFVNNDCVEIHLNNFPVSYLYTSILLPIYEEAVRSGMLDAREVSEMLFAQECMSNLRCKSAREVQEYALSYCVKHAGIKIKQHCYYRLSENFIPTESNAAARNLLEEFISIKRLQRAGKLKADGIGLNGVLIEGASGIGKSALIEYMLEEMGYQIKNPFEEQGYNSGGFVCYKIDASLSLAKKQTILLRAFREGNAVWIDEINGCVDDGLEKLLNALLTGVDLDKHVAPKKGFMMFGTANGIAMEGRSILSPALKDRCLNVKLVKDSEKDIELILKNNFPNIHFDIFLMAKDFVVLREQNKHVNLRSFLKVIESNVALFKQLYPARMQGYTNTVCPNRNPVEMMHYYNHHKHLRVVDTEEDASAEVILYQCKHLGTIF